MKFNHFILLVIGAILNGCGCGSMVSKAKKISIKGVVISKYEMETGCFGALVVKQGNDIDTIVELKTE